MNNLDKLIDIIIKKNGCCDSSTLNSCSVRVNNSPLLSDCVVDGRLVSDLELALVNNNQSVLEYLQNTVRSPKFAKSGSRHISAAELFDLISSMDSELDSLKDKASASAPAPAPASAPAPAPASAPAPAPVV